MTDMMVQATLTLVIVVLFPHFIDGDSLDLQVLRPDVTKENISSRIGTQEELEEVWKEAGESLYTRREVRHECPWPFQLIAGSCLHFGGSTRKSWESARKYCWALDADLATFGDLQELLLLIGYMDEEKSGDYWIGGSRNNSTSDFQWLDGSSLPDTSSPLWDYVDRTDYDCVTLQKTNNSYKFRNIYCPDTSTFCGKIFCSRNPHGYGKLCKLI